MKKVDYVQKTALRNYGQALTPLVKALELMQGYREPEVEKSYVIDSFKILCLQVKATNLNRLEQVKKELHPKFKPLVPEEPSETKQLGDSFQDAVTKVEGTKANLSMSSQLFFREEGRRQESVASMEADIQAKSEPDLQKFLQGRRKQQPDQQSKPKLHQEKAKQYKEIKVGNNISKGTSRQRSGKGAIRKRFPLQKPRWEKTKLTIRYLYHETYRKPNEQLFSQ